MNIEIKKSYRTDGSVMFENSMLNEKYCGIQKHSHSNGKLYTLAYEIDGWVVGIYQRWHYDGNLEMVSMCNKRSDHGTTIVLKYSSL